MISDFLLSEMFRPFVLAVYSDLGTSTAFNSDRLPRHEVVFLDETGSVYRHFHESNGEVELRRDNFDQAIIRPPGTCLIYDYRVY
jgi:hypothetical protein